MPPDKKTKKKTVPASLLETPVISAPPVSLFDGWVFHVQMKDKPFIFFYVVFSHLFRYVRIFFGVT